MKRFLLRCFKWYKMLLKKDTLHVDQGIGKQFAIGEIQGYFNDMTSKIIKAGETDEVGLPINVLDNGEKCHLTVAILQYGLGNYDLYLETEKKAYLDSFMQCVKWTEENQKENGSINIYGDIFSFEEEYSAMTQGQLVSLFIRAYIQTKEEKYLLKAKKGLDFMLMPVEESGTTVYEENGFYFEELFDEGQKAVLNGWIFALFGLYDYCVFTKDEIYNKKFQQGIQYLAKSLYKYDRKYWSNYNQNGTITSPFYHDLHLAQLEALVKISDLPEFASYLEKWTKYRKSKIYCMIAFFRKVIQKLANYNDAKIVVIK